MEELLVVRDGEEQVTIFGKTEGETIEEMLILIGGDDNAMIFLKGRLKPELISSLIEKNKADGFLSFQN